MGKLQRLEVENFKSYAGKQIVGPFDNFTCIIGPNGAGKSNMMDAISFVLGVQSKHLRSSHLKDLLFRKDADSPPARKASVKLVYQLHHEELESYPDGYEIEFQRNISSAGVSSYKLDGKDVTYETYESILQKIGVLVKARNFLVFQGDVEAVASKSPLELTKLLEQVSGSDAYVAEYEQLIKQKNESEENTIFCMQKKKMYTTQCKEIKEQKDEAEAFALKQEELRDARTEQILWQLWRIKTEMDSHQQSVDDGRGEMDVLKSTENEMEEEVAASKKELAKISKLLNTSEKDLLARTKTLQGITPKLDEVRQKLKSLQNRLKSISKKESDVVKDIAEQQEQIAELNRQIVTTNNKEKSVKKQLEAAAASGVKMDKSKIAEYSSLREEVSKRTAASQAEILTISLELNSKIQHLERLEAQHTSVLQEMEVGTKFLSDYNERKAKIEAALASSNQELSRMQTEKKLMAENLRTSASKMQSINAEMDQITSKLRDVGEDRRRSKQEERLAEALESMQRIYKGVYGKLGDLCRPIQKKYSQAVLVAAGKQMDAIVVSTKQVASDCIAYLKEQRIGTCIFLPLDSLTVKPLPERVRMFGKNYRPCVDLIESEDMFKVAVSYAVGSTVVCDTLEEAQQLCFDRNERVKTVTIKGQIISKSGAMTGGSSASLRAGGLDRWEEREILQMRARKTELEIELADINGAQASRQQIIDHENACRQVAASIQYSEADLKNTLEKITSFSQQQKLREKAIKVLATEISTLKVDIDRLKHQQTQADSITKAVETEVFAEFSSSVGVENIRDYEQKHLAEQQELRDRLSAIGKRSAELTAQLNRWTEMQMDNTLAQLKLQCSEAEEEIRLRQEEEGALLQKEDQVLQKVRVAKDKVAEQKAQRSIAVEQIKELQSRLTELQHDSSTLLKKLAGHEMAIERGRAQLHDTLRKAQVDEISLPAIEIESSSSSAAAAAAASGGAALTATGKRGRNNALSSSSEDDEDSSENGGAGASSASGGSGSGAAMSIDYDKELEWRGSLSQAFSASGGRGSSSGSGSGSRDSSSNGSSSKHFSQSENLTVVRDSKKAARVDLSSMNRYKNWARPRLLEKEVEIEKNIARLVGELERITPNMHAGERFESVSEKLRECNAELDELRETARTYGMRFEDVKRMRQLLFNECFSHVTEALVIIYKDLTKSSKHPLGGNAYLTLENTEEPYLGGTRFTAMPPMKRFRDMDQLSGGEKTMAALSMLFSIHSFRQAPFFVLDEVDAALDNVNVNKICNYIRKRSVDFQCVVISLKEMFFEHADSLVGICKDVDSLSSKILTLDLSAFAANADHTGAAEGDVDEGLDVTVTAGGYGDISMGAGGGGSGSVAGRSPAVRSMRSSPGGTGGSGGSGGSGGGELGKRARTSGAGGGRRTGPAAIQEEEESEDDSENDE